MARPLTIDEILRGYREPVAGAPSPGIPPAAPPSPRAPLARQRPPAAPPAEGPPSSPDYVPPDSFLRKIYEGGILPQEELPPPKDPLASLGAALGVPPASPIRPAAAPERGPLDFLEAGQRKSGELGLTAALSKAGAMVGAAIGGQKVDPAFDQLAQMAKEPLNTAAIRAQRLEGLMEQKRLMDKEKADRALADLAAKEKRLDRAERRQSRADELEYRKQQAADLARHRRVIEGTAQTRAERAPAGGGAGGGKMLPATEVASIAGMGTAASMLDDLENTRMKLVGPGGAVTQFIPGTQAAQYTDARDAAAQVIGIILEGGKLGEADLPRYKKMMPDASDSKERADRKRENIKNLLAAKRRETLNAYQRAGYSIGTLGEEGAGAAPPPSATSGAVGRFARDPETGERMEITSPEDEQDFRDLKWVIE